MPSTCNWEWRSGCSVAEAISRRMRRPGAHGHGCFEAHEPETENELNRKERRKRSSNELCDYNMGVGASFLVLQSPEPSLPSLVGSSFLELARLFAISSSALRFPSVGSVRG